MFGERFLFRCAARLRLSDVETARNTLSERVVPAASQSPGFVAGYWTWSNDQSNGLSMIVFESMTPLALWPSASAAWLRKAYG